MKGSQDDKSLTGSEIGSYHWFGTLLGQHLRMGEFLKDKTPDEKTLRAWGKSLYDSSKQIIGNRDLINIDVDKCEHKYELLDVTTKRDKFRYNDTFTRDTRLCCSKCGDIITRTETKNFGLQEERPSWTYGVTNVIEHL